jgi:hypothetical protein
MVDVQPPLKAMLNMSMRSARFIDRKKSAFYVKRKNFCSWDYSSAQFSEFLNYNIPD